MDPAIRRRARAINTARWVSLICAFIWGAVAEWRLGMAVGVDPYTAGLLPLTLDVYGFAAFRSGYRAHVYSALLAMFASQAVSHVLELHDAEWHRVALAVAVSAIAPGASLACHRMGDRLLREATAQETAGDTAASPVESPQVSSVDTAAEDATVAVLSVASVDSVPDDDTGGVHAASAAEDTPTEQHLSKEEIAAMAVRLRRENPQRSWDDIAASIGRGYRRQWVHRCMKETGITV